MNPGQKIIQSVFKLLDRFGREPVMFFGAAGLAITAWAPDAVDTDAKKAALAAIILWLQRSFSTSKRTHEEQVDVARYAGQIEGEARSGQ